MVLPPPPPPDAFDPDGIEALLEQAFTQPEARRSVMARLRGQDSMVAQLAAALLCFDLARGGEQTAQQELGLLRPVLDLMARRDDIEALLRDPRLIELWRDARHTLGNADPRDYAPVLPLEGADEVMLPLLDDGDTPVEGIVGDAAQEALARALELRRMVQRHLEGDYSRRVVRLGQGFRLTSQAQVDRLERFLTECEARAGLVPAARGLSCLGWLWLGTNLRRHNIFGALNLRRASAVRKGLGALDADLESMLLAAGLFAFETEPAAGFQKVIELWLDYLTFCHASGRDPQVAESAAAYADLGRLPPTVLAAGERRRR